MNEYGQAKTTAYRRLRPSVHAHRRDKKIDHFEAYIDSSRICEMIVLRKTLKRKIGKELLTQEWWIIQFLAYL